MSIKNDETGETIQINYRINNFVGVRFLHAPILK